MRLQYLEVEPAQLSEKWNFCLFPKEKKILFANRIVQNMLAQVQ